MAPGTSNLNVLACVFVSPVPLTVTLPSNLVSGGLRKLSQHTEQFWFATTRPKVCIQRQAKLGLKHMGEGMQRLHIGRILNTTERPLLFLFVLVKFIAILL